MASCLRWWNRRGALISSWESTKLQLAVENHWQEDTGTHQEKIPRVQKQRKPQRDSRRGAIMIKSNPIPTGWVTHRLENNNTKDVLVLLWRFWTPHQSSQPGDLTKELGIPRESYLEGNQIWLQDFHRTSGNRDSSLGGHKQNLVHTKTQGKEGVTSQETELKLPTRVGGFPVEAWVVRGSPQGRGHWQQQSWRPLLA